MCLEALSISDPSTDWTGFKVGSFLTLGGLYCDGESEGEREGAMDRVL